MTDIPTKNQLLARLLLALRDAGLTQSINGTVASAVACAFQLQGGVETTWTIRGFISCQRDTLPLSMFTLDAAKMELSEIQAIAQAEED